MSFFDQLFPTRLTIYGEGDIKTLADDFQVTELVTNLNFSGEGEHLWLWVKKVNHNTDWVAQCLAKAAQVAVGQIGYAGLKDRHAVTKQWFSIQLPIIDNIEHLQQQLPGDITILDAHRHNKKLKIGYLKGNQFNIRVKNFTGDQAATESNIENIKSHGVPNYFGPQRFGHNLNNIQKAKELFSGQLRTRDKKFKSLLLSVARSHIFNNILKTRIKQNVWNQLIKGDLIVLDGSRSWFDSQVEKKEKLIHRLKTGDVHISAAMWGEDPLPSSQACAQLEQTVANKTPDYLPGFEQFRLRHERRTIRLIPKDFEHNWTENDLEIHFTLPAGCYATSILREILLYKDISLQKN